MYVVLGASGNTGHIVAKSLLARQQKVRVVGRNAAHLQPFAAQGAEVFVGDATDAAAVTQALHQADSAYVMVPPSLTSNDPLGHYDRVSDAIAAAVRNSKIKNVVALSSIGAHMPSGTGPVVGLHNFEHKLSQIAGTNVLFLRPAYFMENTLPQTAVIRMMGAVAGPLRPDLNLPMIATRDIGAAAADALLKLDFLGKAIGKPDLQPPNDQMRAGLVQSGVSEQLAELLLEMTGSLNSGDMRGLESRTPRNTTPTSFETFAAEVFAPVYRQQAAA